jgi:hypothetical protein
MPGFECGSQTAHVCVTIEHFDGSVVYRDWKGTSVKAIHRAARAKYAKEFPGSRVAFGEGYYTYHYGAH